MKGLIVLAHGSKVNDTKETLQRYIEAISNKLIYDYVSEAYLQLMTPDLHDAIENMIESGVKQIDIFPLFLFKGNHMLMSIPLEVASAQEKYPGHIIKLYDCIGYDEALVESIINRLRL